MDAVPVHYGLIQFFVLCLFISLAICRLWWRIFKLNVDELKSQNAHGVEKAVEAKVDDKLEGTNSEARKSDGDWLTAEMRELSDSGSDSNAWLDAAEQKLVNDGNLDQEIAKWRQSLEHLVKIKRLVDEKAEELVADMSYCSGRSLKPFFTELLELMSTFINEKPSKIDTNEDLNKRQKPLPFLEELKQTISDRSQNSSPLNSLKENLSQTPSCKIPKFTESTPKTIKYTPPLLKPSYMPTPNVTPNSIRASMMCGTEVGFMDELREKISHRNIPSPIASGLNKDELCVGGPLKFAQEQMANLSRENNNDKDNDSRVIVECVHESIENDPTFTKQ